MVQANYVKLMYIIYVSVYRCVIATVVQVAAVSGDARRALDIARRATEIAQLEKGAGLVGIPHIDKAVQEMFSSAKIQSIRYSKRLLCTFVHVGP